MGVVEKVKQTLRDFRRPKQMDLVDYIAKLRDRGLNDAGQLIPDSTPIAPPIGYKRQPTMVEIVRDMVRNERLAQDLAAGGVETFEDADDFDVGDDGEDLKSGFENDFDPPVKELVAAGAEELKRKAVEKAREAEELAKAAVEAEKNAK